MIWDLKKYNKEIRALKSLPEDPGLHPLRKMQIKQSLMQAISDPVTAPISHADQAKPAQSWLQTGAWWKLAGSALMLLFFAATGTAFASSLAKPGDILFPVKKAAENIQLTFTVGQQAKANLQEKFAKERADEFLEIQAELPVPIKLDNSNPDNQNSSKQDGGARNGKNDPAGKPSPTLKNDDDVQAKVEATDKLSDKQKKSVIKAQTEVMNAINRLTVLSNQLKSKGDSKSSDKIEKTIHDLRLKIILKTPAPTPTPTPSVIPSPTPTPTPTGSASILPLTGTGQIKLESK